MGRYLFTLPLIGLLLSGCYFDMVGDSKPKKKASAQQHIQGFKYNNYDKNKLNDWSITGDSSTINQDQSLNLKKPHLTLKNENNPITITGNKGGWDPETRELTIKDKVIATSTSMGMFTTDSLAYSSPKKDFYTKDTVRLHHTNISIGGTGVFGNTEAEFIEILGDIKVIITLPSKQQKRQKHQKN